MLGRIRRTVLGKGPEHFKDFFVVADCVRSYNTRAADKRHQRQLRNWRSGPFLDVVKRSSLGTRLDRCLQPPPENRSGSVDCERFSEEPPGATERKGHSRQRGLVKNLLSTCTAVETPVEVMVTSPRYTTGCNVDVFWNSPWRRGNFGSSGAFAL